MNHVSVLSKAIRGVFKLIENPATWQLTQLPLTNLLKHCQVLLFSQFVIQTLYAFVIYCFVDNCSSCFMLSSASLFLFYALLNFTIATWD